MACVEYSQLRKVSGGETFEAAFSDNILSHLRVTDSAQAAEAQEKFAACREYVEQQTGRPFFNQVWELTRSNWAYRSESIGLGRAPVSAITSIVYRDTDNAEQTLSPSQYQVYGSESAASWVWFDPEAALPSLYHRPDAVKITFTAGHGATIGAVPGMLKEAAKSLCYHWWDNRSAVNVGNIVNELPLTFTSLLISNRVGGFIA